MGSENDEPTRQRREIDPSNPQGGGHQSGPTRIAGRPASGQGKAAPEAGSQSPTVINPGPSAGQHTTISRPQPSSADTAEAYQPVTGWLVAVAGPGKGKSRPIFEGRNQVGRDPGQRIPLDFGDTEISREKHFFITYDPKKRAFHISAGDKENLVYLNGDVILESKVLNQGCEIEVGKTKLRFVPLCGPDFSWDEA
ncbi:FHA domain-containing protein [Bradyrhizobium sp. 180]|uniref:FHA domain-containing protein n=1 Tax=Bradyrhizobium sp. 180 TaxID=2782650 RepID=UPI001FF8AD55|nr:FHA domain-containing protein [Bradyrhizobium sp. 180]MCK1489749.1 FHA domain-containing protein [Bradyrhizobium sp. 180]